MASRVGERLGDYRLIRLLGEGSFGDVYLGEPLYEQTQVAVKVFKTQLTPDKMKDFINEVRVIRLRHDHIVELLDFGMADDNTPYLVMKYAPHGTLLQRHPRGTPLPLATVVSYITPLASALQYAHDRRLIHRDVKPENMLFGEQNEVLLTDFGIAVVAHTTRSQRVEEAIGTTLYMSPEQWAGKPVPATDQYALGIIAYEWLSGESPFQGNMQQLLYQHLHVSPPPLLKKLPSLAPEVEQAILIATAKEAGQRFATIQAFAHALQQASHPTTALPVSPHSPGALPPTERAAISALPPTERAIVSALPPTERAVVSPRPPIGVVSLPIGTALLRYSGHTSAVIAVAWSPDGRWLASASADKSVQVWDGVTGAQLLRYGGHIGWVWAVAWSPDGRRVASASADGSVQVWDGVTGAQLLHYVGHSSDVKAVAWSPDGRRVASASADGSVQVWDGATGAQLLSYAGHSDRVSAVAWSPDGRQLASADKSVQVWDGATGAQLLRYGEHTDRVWAVAWSPDGRRLASASNDKSVQVWQAV